MNPSRAALGGWACGKDLPPTLIDDLAAQQQHQHPNGDVNTSLPAFTFSKKAADPWSSGLPLYGIPGVVPYITATGGA